MTLCAELLNIWQVGANPQKVVSAEIGYSPAVKKFMSNVRENEVSILESFSWNYQRFTE